MREEIFAYGLRNPWRSSFDSATDMLFIGDVGGTSFEEINIGQSGANYGWPIAEGFERQSGLRQSDPRLPARRVGASITGGYVYRGETDGLNGQYFFADFTTGRLSTLRFDGASWVATDRTAQIHDRRRHDRCRRRRSARTRAAISISSTSTAKSSG